MSGAGPEGGFRVGPDADPDKYVIGEAVNAGAEGTLYRGSLHVGEIEHSVAIKVLHPRFLPSVQEWHTRWSEQVELLRSVQGPGVVGGRDLFIGALPHPPGEAGEGRGLYLIMNWVEGESLDEWVRHHPERDPFDTLKLLVNVAAALDLMHSGHNTAGVPVIHRDVKPANIIVTARGDSVLVDFGLTRGLPAGQRLSGVTGTPGYLPPEASEAGVYTPSTDRYALGAVAYFVFTGREPPTTHQPQVLRAALSVVDALADRPEAVEHVMAMLADDPDTRPVGLANWVAQLRRSSLANLPEVLAPVAPGRHREHPVGTRHPNLPGTPPRRRRRRLPVAVTVTLSAVTLTVVVAASAA
ncbi:MAG: serine/threonine protein kinase, partial [Actinobacteria bacterium]|nr:serine/threonine protein kinase [Actinomycetota bacterium]